MNDKELKESGFTKDKDGTTHHPSNKANCSKCMDLWIERENAKVISFKAGDSYKIVAN